MKFGDKVRLEMTDARGQSIFGAINQTVRKYQAPACEMPVPGKTKNLGGPR